MEIKIQIQPKESNLCGQYCIAMILGINASIIIKKMKKKFGTSPKHLRNCLYDYGYKMDNFLNLNRHELPELCILKIRFKKKDKGHWVVCYKNTIYDSDPCLSTNPSSIFDYLIQDEFIIVSSAKITKIS